MFLSLLRDHVVRHGMVGKDHSVIGKLLLIKLIDYNSLNLTTS